MTKSRLRDVEQMMLERLGYQVTVRTSSPDALDAFRANPVKIRSGDQRQGHAEYDRGAACQGIDIDQAGYSDYSMHRVQR